jgi:hypothetical protein
VRKIRVAIAQAEVAPDLAAGLDKTRLLTRQAAGSGAKLVVFPETWLPGYPAWLDHWVELTGHFDDPASAQCRWMPDIHSGQAPYSAQSVINSCRQQFVVTRIRVVSGP